MPAFWILVAALVLIAAAPQFPGVEWDIHQRLRLLIWLLAVSVATGAAGVVAYMLRQRKILVLGVIGGIIGAGLAPFVMVGATQTWGLGAIDLIQSSLAGVVAVWGMIGIPYATARWLSTRGSVIQTQRPEESLAPQAPTGRQEMLVRGATLLPLLVPVLFLLTGKGGLGSKFYEIVLLLSASPAVLLAAIVAKVFRRRGIFVVGSIAAMLGVFGSTFINQPVYEHVWELPADPVERITPLALRAGVSALFGVVAAMSFVGGKHLAARRLAARRDRIARDQTETPDERGDAMRGRI